MFQSVEVKLQRLWAQQVKYDSFKNVVYTFIAICHRFFLNGAHSVHLKVCVLRWWLLSLKQNRSNHMELFCSQSFSLACLEFSLSLCLQSCSRMRSLLSREADHTDELWKERSPCELNPELSHHACSTDGDHRSVSQGNDYSSIIGLGDKCDIYHNISTGLMMCNGNASTEKQFSFIGRKTAVVFVLFMHYCATAEIGIAIYC